MTNRNKKVNELKIFDLLKEAFSIPNGWKEEVYVEDGYVTFSSHDFKYSQEYIYLIQIFGI